MNLIIVSVGTDHHPFNRLIDWVDSWESEQDVKFVIQRGTSKESTKWKSDSLIAHNEILEMFAMSQVVVSHGGPSTVMDIRKSGKMPIVVPRNPEFGEHVDNHQMLFAEHMMKSDIAKVANSKDELFELIGQAISNPNDFVISKQEGFLPGVLKFGEVLDGLLDTSTPIVPDNLKMIDGALLEPEESEFE